ncbi:MAG TPA: 3-phosphoserine/phosphohydroxythreonine transaminase [Fimbriimonadaceae bacterium]|nr:3-phosphoserine/phosphohydroxythreonine transaminase [Fimbriimonadaceae bacterium]
MSQPYDRAYNFSAGPCTLEVEVLEEAREGLLNWKGTGMSVMEMSHRGKAYESIIQQTEADLRKLMNVPENYKVLFLQGGASLQNTMIPMSFLGQGQTADYIVTGAWGKKSEEAAQMIGNVHNAYSGKSHNYSDVPGPEEIQLSENPVYVHYTSNETIQGVEFPADLHLSAPLVCDMSSDILSRPVDVSNFQLIYAGAQKNMGPAGTTVVLISEEMLAKAPEKTHPMLDYRLQSANDSMYNTPPCWGIYMCGLTYAWLLRNGGVPAMHERNKEKAAILYRAIDGSGGFYKGHSCPHCRSLMNVTFTLPNEDLTKEFIKVTEENKLDGLKGHRSVGGLRASIYNAFPKEGCEVLADVMKDFAQRKG